ncbi:MAG: MCE family protein, partial [Methyloprofundus sp.]|nr:MCE family protein [Methyloprofundus sp.]
FKNKHLDTIIKGNYLEIEPGHGARQSEFIGELNQPEIRQGLHIILKSPNLGSIKVGNTVSYRQIPVGEVSGFKLAKNAQSVLIDIVIAQKYAALIKNNTKFWHASGVQMDFGLFSGAQVRTESLEHIVLGGIAFATPDHEDTARAYHNQVFELYANVESEWLEWRPVIVLAD